MHVLMELVDGHLHKTSSLEKMDFNRVKWLDLHDPTDADLKLVCDLVGVSMRELKGSLDRDEFARVTELEHFTMIVSKVPLEQKHHSHIATTSLTFLVSERLMVTLHRDEVVGVSRLLSSEEEELVALLQKGTSDLFYEIFERSMGDFFSRLDDVESRIDKIEDLALAKPEQKTVRQIFTLKRTLIYFHKALAANRDVLVSLQKPGAGKQIRPGVQRRLNHLYYDAVQLLDVVATYRDILTGTLDIYLSSVSNNMNAVMKKMSAYGALVLVPTFVTGLYGMNFRLMPELNWQFGYAFAWGMIILSIVLVYVYFKRKDWF